MRVAVRFPTDHPLVQGEGEPVIAYRLGRIEDGVHNAPIGHEPVELEEFVQSLVEQAKAEYPDAEVRVERLVDNGDGTSRWIARDEFDPAEHAPVGAGVTAERTVGLSLQGDGQAQPQAGG